MITLTDTQATRLSENGTLAIVRPLVQQPPEGSEEAGLWDKKYVVFATTPPIQPCRRKIRYPVGKEVKCRKRISLDTEVVYAVFTTTVMANRVCPVQDMNDNEINSTNMTGLHKLRSTWLQSFADAFNSQFAKPVMRTVDGKKQYVAWAWGWDSWEQSYGQNDKYEEYSYNGVLCQYWDKLKITVHCNPFVEIVTVNTEEN